MNGCKKFVGRSKFLKGSTLASIRFCPGFVLRLVRKPIKAPHRLLDARLKNVAFTPPIGKFMITVKSRGDFNSKPAVLMRVTKNTSLHRVQKCVKRAFKSSGDQELQRIAKRAKTCTIMGLECGEWDHSVITLEDLRVDVERSHTLSYSFLGC